MKRAICCLMAALVMLPMFAGLAGAEGTVINFYAHSDNTRYIEAQVEAFNALGNGITVVPHIIPNEAYDDKLKVLTAGGGSDTDVFWVRTPSAVQQYMRNGALADISGFAKESGLDLAPIEQSLKAVSDANGGFYGLPTSGSAWLLFYNKTLFDEAGLPYPEQMTWTEYADLAKQLTTEKDGKKVWGGVCPNWTLNLGAAAAGEYLTAEAPMARTTQYMELLHRLYVDDKSHLGIAEMNATSFDINALFTSNSMYMMINGDWELQLLPQDFEYGIAPLPVLDGVEPGSTVGQSAYYCVSVNSQHQKEAYQFVEFCNASPDGGKILASMQAVPSYSTPEALEVYKQSVNVPGIDFRFSAKVSAEQGSESYYADLTEAFRQEMDVYLLGEQSIEDAFNNFYALRDEAVANNA